MEKLMKLYHYVHCPFCVRVRMGLGFLNLNYESKVLRYDDEKTPVSFTGKKMLPIFQRNDGSYLNESLDIIKELDTKNSLNWDFFNKHQEKIENHLNQIGNHVHNMAMPYWVWTPEFDEKSRAYFEEKKSQKRGPFKELAKKKDDLIPLLNAYLETTLLPHLKPFYESDTLTIADIMIASHLWGMYCVCEYQFPPKIQAYLMQVKKLAHFDYHADFWK